MLFPSPVRPPGLFFYSKVFMSKLEKLLERSRNCSRCHLHLSRTNFVFGEGNSDASLLLIGEAPGTDEDLHGKPFIGRCGRHLNKILEEEFELRRERDYYITNICHCRPTASGKDRPPTKEEMSKCSWITEQIIRFIKPKVILAMGNTANGFLSGEQFYITRMRGIRYTYKGVTVIPTFHPSYLIRNNTPDTKQKFLSDVKKALSLL